MRWLVLSLLKHIGGTSADYSGVDTLRTKNHDVGWSNADDYANTYSVRKRNGHKCLSGSHSMLMAEPLAKVCIVPA